MRARLRIGATALLFILPAAVMAQSAPRWGPDPAFAAGGMIKGISISPPVDDWTAEAYGMTEARLDALRAAGFNTLRTWISLEEFLYPQPDMNQTLAKWMAHIGRSEQAGFKVKVSWASTWEERLQVLNDPATRERFHTALRALCGALDRRYPASQVALEMLNEPPGEHLAPGYYRSAAPGWFRACRDAAPDLTIIIQPVGGWHGAMSGFSLDDYDWNTIFAFHPYSPGEFTHQGIGSQPHLYPVPMPITRYVGGRSQMIADMEARVHNDRYLSAQEKLAEVARYTHLIHFLWWKDGSEWENWDQLEDWVSRSGINPRRIMAGEFGVVSQFNYNGTPALQDVSSRAHFLRKVRDQTEANDFSGWVVHQALGDFNLFEQTGIGQHGERLIPELVTALFGTQPIPPGPPVAGGGR
jgi:hypothetical protein